VAERRIAGAAAAIAVLLTLAPAARADAASAAAGVTVTAAASAATVGDRVPVEIRVDLADGETFEPPAIGPDLGPFRVGGGAWRRPPEGGRTWTWTGFVAAYRTGDLELPAIDLTVGTPEGPRTRSSAPVAIRIDSVLPGGEDPAGLDIAEIKDVVTVAPDWSALRLALAALVGLLAAAGAIAWAHRRWAARLSAAPAPPDPFERLPPHEWAFRELQALLERRLHEEGRVDEFHAEVARIVKRYLGGRYRVDLMERTTGEVGPALDQAGAPGSAIAEVGALLTRCDTVKFAGARPAAERCRATVEDAYRLVDSTRPAAASPAEEGAA